jgi:hypothetical protein
MVERSAVEEPSRWSGSLVALKWSKVEMAWIAEVRFSNSDDVSLQNLEARARGHENVSWAALTSFTERVRFKLA